MFPSKTNDIALFRYHTDDKNLLQKMFQVLAGYFPDNVADELTNDPTFKTILDKSTFASQPTLSRFMNRLDEDTLFQLEEIAKVMRRKIYSIEEPEMVLLDIDSTLLNTYGNQEGNDFNYHYSNYGYHP
ncbi:MAG: transposase, partial [Alkaliphilus sp.]|nr:transposase [Alkaliphilus sp.]